MIYTNIVNKSKKINLSISKLEEKAGLSKGIISKWKTAIPTVDNLKAVADVLEVTVDELITK